MINDEKFNRTRESSSDNKSSAIKKECIGVHSSEKFGKKISGGLFTM